MIKDVSELKELILWAKSQKIRSLKVGGAEFEFSELALIDGLPDLAAPESKPKDLSVPTSSKHLPEMTDEQQSEKEFEETLFHSTR